MSLITVIEDNENIRIELERFLKSKNFNVDCPCDFKDIEKNIKETKPDLILLDINLGEYNGFDICKKIRKEMDTPIIFLTCRDSDKDELIGFMYGADDYIKKPYNLNLVLARINSILSRRNNTNEEEITVNGVSINIVTSKLKYNDKVLDLSKNELKIIYYLFTNKDKVLSKDTLIEALWDSKFYIDENILHVNLSRLRKRLSDIGLDDFIKTVPNKGYMV
jgi:DNA-binding response OmpR family regulator